MKLLRFKKTKTSVMGVMKDDKGGTFFTMENAATLIPCGTYSVALCDSPKFGRKLPLITGPGVGAERGVRMHAGSTYKDSSACILVGDCAGLDTMALSRSAQAVDQLCRAVSNNTLEILDAY